MQTSPNTVVGAAAAVNEEAPLKGAHGAGGGGGAGCGGARGVAACFGALTLAVTAALLAQIYYHDYQEEGPWRGAVSAEARCSGAGAGALLAGGGALDAALAAAACLAAERPLSAPLDASGALLLWRYGPGRAARAVQWGGAAAPPAEWPRALCALCTLHARSGAPLAKLPLARLLAPAILLARESSSTAPLADYLSSLRNYTTTEISSLCSGAELLHEEDALSAPLSDGTKAGGAGTQAGGAGTKVEGGAGGWRVTAAGAGGAALVHALQVSVAYNNSGGAAPVDVGGGGGGASGVAIADARDNYVALVLGVSASFGAAAAAAGGGAWLRDSPAAPLDLTPIILTQDAFCGVRVLVAGGAARAALGVAARLLAGPAPDVAARLAGPRLVAAPDLRAAVEAPRDGEGGATSIAAEADAAVNVVAVAGDALTAHADSRGAGLAQTY